MEKFVNIKNGETVCKENNCNGCMACLDICSKNAITINDKLYAYNANINPNLCVKCNACYSVCPNNQRSIMNTPKKWYQGWVLDEQVRMQSSSGGLATELARTFVESNGIVCSCIFYDGEFKFGFAENEFEIKKFAGSKYVKSNPIGVYKKIKEMLKEDKRILFIGLPCQVSALKNFVGKYLGENLYTIDLICHGTPSPRLLELFLQQYNKKLKSLKQISFREKNIFGLREGKRSIVTSGICDRYTMAFLDSLIYTENCYQCNFAKKERISDLTLGDSWGSNLPLQEIEKGISLVLCQTQKGSELLKNAKLHLEDVDLEIAIKNNRQLNAPSTKPKGRTKFFKGLLQGKKFNKLVFMNYPKLCIRQDIKEILIKMKIIH